MTEFIEVEESDAVLCREKAVMLIASVINQIAGVAPEGETPDQRDHRFNSAARFLFDTIMGAVHARARDIVMAEAEASTTVRQ